MKKVFLLTTLLMVLSAQAEARKQRLLTEKDMGAYLFTYFNDQTHSLFMAISYDGYSFTAVNGNQPVISGDSIADQRGIRDPHIYRAPNGKFYIAMTDLHVFGKQKGLRLTQWERPQKYDWGNNRGLVLMASDDLIHWTHHEARIDQLFPERFGELGCAWAPQTIWDPAVGKPMVYFTIREKPGARTRLYYSYADEDFTTLVTEPQVLFDYPDEKIQTLDADICPMPDGRYFMTYVAQENPGGIKYMVSDKINHFNDYHAEQIDGEDRGCEAPNVWKRIGEQKWVIMYDIYSVTPHNFGFVETSDFKTFKPLGRFNEGVMTATNFVAPKHGSVIHITRKEARRLEQYWASQPKRMTVRSGELWRDDAGRHVNAHGGGVLKYGDTYYWFGEHKADTTSRAMVGVMCYASEDLVRWRNLGVALSVSDEKGSDIERGCVLERPKVIYNKVTGKFCMWFHLELKGKGYHEARYGVAVSDRPEGPYRFLYSQRANPGTWPVEFGERELAVADTLEVDHFREWWKPDWYRALDDGLFVKRDFATGQMSRDMTLYVDDDGKAYHIYSSEDNLTLHIAELTNDYLHHTGRYTRVAPGGHNEALAIFRKDGTYWMITSGCTGWEPNEARMFSAPSIWGPWTQHPNPCKGPRQEITFGGQSTYILPVGDRFIFMADIWRPKHPSDARYIWLPITFSADGKPEVRWQDEWSPDSLMPREEWKLVWSDEFDRDGAPDSTVWTFEEGFCRNHEDQWYQRENAWQEGGRLIIEARKERRPNPTYEPGSEQWGKKREFIDYTSACLKTIGKRQMCYGRLEVRAKIPTAGGAWPAIWTLGSGMEWPSCGEIDVMEYYRIDGKPHILANAAWGNDWPYSAVWNTRKIPFIHFTHGDPSWAERFHIWRMDWDESRLRIYLDDELLNEISLSETVNGRVGNRENPFRKPHYILLDLAIGGDNGGVIDDAAMPMRYEIDYVRVYEKGIIR